MKFDKENLNKKIEEMRILFNDEMRNLYYDIEKEYNTIIQVNNRVCSLKPNEELIKQIDKTITSLTVLRNDLTFNI